MAQTFHFFKTFQDLDQKCHSPQTNTVAKNTTFPNTLAKNTNFPKFSNGPKLPKRSNNLAQDANFFQTVNTVAKNDTFPKLSKTMAKNAVLPKLSKTLKWKWAPQLFPKDYTNPAASPCTVPANVLVCLKARTCESVKPVSKEMTLSIMYWS